MKHISKLLGISLIAIVILGSCQKMDQPALPADYPTDDNQVLLPGDLRFFASFNNTTGVSPRWNASDSISTNPALLFPASYEPGITGNGIKGTDNNAILYLNANDFKTATSFTVAFWMKNTDAGRTEFVFSLKDDTYSGWHRSAMFLMMEHGNATETTLKFGLMDQWLEFPDASKFPRPLLDGNWHHLAFSYDQTTSKMTYYFDGAVVPAPVSASDVKNVQTAGNPPRGAVNFSNASNLVIGGWNKHAKLTGPTDDWIKSYTGNLDQFRLYNKPLSAAEVMTLFTSKQ